jgi:GNAT superfamily N-acetyltransferase
MVHVRDAKVADAAVVARVHVDSWKTAYQGLIPEAVLSRLSYEERASKWADILSSPKPGEFTLIAAADLDEIIGFANAGPERQGLTDFPGELYALYLLSSYRGQGLGTRLFASVAARLRQAGVSGMVVWVLEHNPYRRFYAKMGGQLCSRGRHVIGGQDYATVAYGWKDLTAWREPSTSAETERRVQEKEGS